MKYEIIQIFSDGTTSRVSRDGLFDQFSEAVVGLRTMIQKMIRNEHLDHVDVKWYGVGDKVELVSDDTEVIGRRVYDVRRIG